MILDILAAIIFVSLLVGVCFIYAWIWHRAEQLYYEEKRRAHNEDERP